MVFVCWLQYIVDLAVPEAQWIKPEIANGEHVDWLRICGWMTTSPVLILFLVSMTTFGGREASVRVVPFLVANQIMFLAGLTSAICVAPARWYIYGIAVATGLYVLVSSAICIRSLYGFFGDQGPDSDGRTLVLVLGLTYFVGCTLAPIAWSCGHSGVDLWSDEVTSAAYLAGDLLSKNLFVVLAVVLKVRYLTDSPRTLTTLVPGLKMENGGRINANGSQMRHRSSLSLNAPPTPSQHQTALMRTANLIGIAPPPPRQLDWDPIARTRRCAE
jgi:bacteriorhodopsin